MAGPLSSTLYHETHLPADILERFKKFRDSGKFCDVTLLVDGEQFHAHKVLLASCSPYFESVLKSHRVIGERLHVPVQTGAVRAFRSILTFLYTGSICIETNDLLELLSMANFLLLFKLKAFLAELLESTISSNNVLAVREAAIKCYLPELHMAANNFIKDNLDLVKPSLVRLDFVKLEELILDKCLHIERGSYLAALVISWVCFRFKERFCLLRLVLCLVDWSDFSPGQVVTLVIKRPQAKELLPTMLSVFEELRNNESILPEMDWMATRMKLEKLAVNAAIEALTNQDDDRSLASAEENSDDDSPSLLAIEDIQMEDFGGGVDVSEDENAAFNADNEVGTIGCKKCTFIAKGDHAKSLLRNHIVQVHVRQITYKCFLCSFKCTWKRQFLDHLRGTHFPQNPPYRCDACEHRTLKISTLVRHRRKHLTNRPLSCDLCTYRCRHIYQLESHCKLHKVERPFVCRWCRRSFVTQNALDVHLKRVHAGERFLRCDRCSYRTRYPHHLATHRRMHLKSVLHCPEAMCKYTTSSETQLQDHIRGHSIPAKTQLCSTCGKTYADKARLLRHMRSHRSKTAASSSATAISKQNEATRGQSSAAERKATEREGTSTSSSDGVTAAEDT